MAEEACLYDQHVSDDRARTRWCGRHMTSVTGLRPGQTWVCPEDQPGATEPASEFAPVYSKVKHDKTLGTQLWFISCCEGWRTSIVCTDMYEWTADWLLGVLGRQPFAPEANRSGT